MSNSGLNEDEKKLLDKNINRREIMLKSLFPTDEVGELQSPDAKQMRIANELMTSQEQATLKVVELRDKHEQHSEVKESVLAYIQQVNAPIIPPMDFNRTREMPDDVSFDITKDELTSDGEVLDVNMFVSGDDDDE